MTSPNQNNFDKEIWVEAWRVGYAVAIAQVARGYAIMTPQEAEREYQADKERAVRAELQMLSNNLPPNPAFDLPIRIVRKRIAERIAQLQDKEAA